MIKRVNEVFPDWLESGIFTTLNSFDVPWKGSVNSKELDIAYHGGHSGDKIISPLVDKLMTNEELTAQGKTMLVSSIMAIYGRNWVKLWETLTFDYNPIENYSMIETETFTGETSLNGLVTGNDTTNASNTITGGTTGENTSTNNNANNIYGFNSTNPVGADNEIGTTTGNTTTTNNETGTVENTSTTETTTSNTGTTTNSKTLTRSGNVGVTTSQQMIQSERELWNWYFFDIVFRDIDKMLTLSIY